MKDLQTFWEAVSLQEGKVMLCRLGSLRLWIGRASKEWGYAVERGDSLQLCDFNSVPLDVVPSDLQWERVAFREAPQELCLSPRVPDRPLVLKPSFPVKIPSKETAEFYALIPLCVGITVQKGNRKIELGEVSTRILSDTWFGDYNEGFLCYSLAFPIERDMETLNPFPHHVLTPISLTNNSDEDLHFEKLCLRPQFLTLYATPKRIWGSEVKIIYEENERSTSLKYSNVGPDIKGVKQIGEPAEVADRSGLKRLTFTSQFSKDLKLNA